MEEDVQRGVCLGKMDGGDKVGISVGWALNGHGLYN
jgi:hypothetical protein